MLAEGEVAVDERGFDGWEFGGAEVFFAEEFVDGAGATAARNMPLASTQPSPSGGAAADEDGARRAEGDEFVGVDGQIVGGDPWGGPAYLRKLPAIQ